jgi:hypothetical protein
MSERWRVVRLLGLIVANLALIGLTADSAAARMPNGECSIMAGGGCECIFDEDPEYIECHDTGGEPSEECEVIYEDLCWQVT